MPNNKKLKGFYMHLKHSYFFCLFVLLLAIITGCFGCSKQLTGVKDSGLNNNDSQVYLLERSYASNKTYTTSATNQLVAIVNVEEKSKLKWYRASGHLEKSDIETKLLEVRYDNKEKELFEAI
jgi:hypothetical protein